VQVVRVLVPPFEEVSVDGINMDAVSFCYFGDTLCGGSGSELLSPLGVPLVEGNLKTCPHSHFQAWLLENAS